jgi:hypothetical protein
MNKISKPLLGVLVVGLRQVRGHVQSPLTKKRLRIGRHVGKVVHDDKHLDHGAQGIEEGHLNGALLRYAITFLPQVDVT